MRRTDMPKKTAKVRVPPLRVPLTDAQRKALANHVGPSAKSLREIPEANFDKAEIIGRGPAGMRAVLEHQRAKRGRPKKGETATGTSTKSIRLATTEWAELERIAKKRRMTLHALVRESLAETRRKAG